MLISAAGPQLACWLLLCSDLALRSGTATRMSPANYDRATGYLTFRTKYDNTQRLPVTAELRKLLDQCLEPSIPFVGQLARHNGHPRSKTGLMPATMKPVTDNTLHIAWGKLKERVGVRLELRPHDLRRTTVRAVYDDTLDLRVAQAVLGHQHLSSTLWYLQANNVQVDLSTLELAKLPTATKGVQ